MERCPEPELMDAVEQARAYAAADFAEPHERFVSLLADRLGGLPERGSALDLGCGPGDVTFRFARAFPGWTVEGLDGAAAMLALAEADPRRAAVADRVRFHRARLPGEGASRADFDLVFSNSLLHHLADPCDLWRAAARSAAPGARLFAMDLRRPSSAGEAEALVDRYVADEPAVLRHDFHRSLLAAYTPREVEAQLAAVGLTAVRVEVISDRHLIVHGALAAVVDGAPIGRACA